MSCDHSSTFFMKIEEMKEDRVLSALASFRDEIIDEIDQLKQLLLSSFVQKHRNQSSETLQDPLASLLNQTFQKRNPFATTNFSSFAQCKVNVGKEIDQNTPECVSVDDANFVSGQISEVGLNELNIESKVHCSQTVKSEVAENLASMSNPLEIVSVASQQRLIENVKKITSDSTSSISNVTWLSEKSPGHNSIVGGIKQTFTCKQCGKDFAYKSSFTKHLRTHTGIRPFVCKLCGKSFSQKGSLKYHIKIHTGDKPFKCKLCGKTFIHRGNLNYHEKTHQKRLYPE